MRSRDFALYDHYKHWFLGRVEDPGAIYAGARLVLLPTIDGHGLSIKTVEAMASGLPLIATRLALRGMGEGALTLEGVVVADAPEDFARALKEAARAPTWSEARREASAARAYYDAHFSAEAYERNLERLVAPMLA